MFVKSRFDSICLYSSFERSTAILCFICAFAHASLHRSQSGDYTRRLYTEETKSTRFVGNTRDNFIVSCLRHICVNSFLFVFFFIYYGGYVTIFTMNSCTKTSYTPTHYTFSCIHTCRHTLRCTHTHTRAHTHIIVSGPRTIFTTFFFFDLLR